MLFTVIEHICMQHDPLIHAQSHDVVIYGFGDILAASCDSKKSKKTGGCFNGSKMFSGCSEACRVAVAPGVDMILADEVHASGRVVDVKTQEPIEGVTIHLALPSGRRFGTHTDKEGSFTLAIKPMTRQENGSKTPQVIDLGTLTTDSTDTEREPITITTDLSPAFRKQHPHLQFGHLLIEDLCDPVVYLNY